VPASGSAARMIFGLIPRVEAAQRSGGCRQICARVTPWIFRGTPLILKMVVRLARCPHIGIKLPAIAPPGLAMA